MKNKKGLSAVVTTLIIILLVLVAVGIIWGVVSNLLDKSKGTIDANTKCLDLDVKATKVVGNGDGTYNVTLTRTSTGGDISGVKVVVYANDSTNTEVLDIAYAITPLQTVIKTTTADSSLADLAGAIASIKITPYFEDDSGVDQLCPTSSSKEF